MRNSTRTANLRAKSQKRRESNKIELRRTILKAAGREFEEYGYDDFSLRRVAERIGYSPTTIYLYFRNKDALLLSTVKDGFDAFDHTIEAAVQGESNPLEKLRSLGRAYIEFGLQNSAIYRLMFMQRSDFYVLPHLIGTTSTPEKIEEVSQEANHRVIAQDVLVATVREAIEAGLLREGDPVLMADTLWAGVHGLVSLATSPLMHPDHARLLSEQLMDVLIAGLQHAQPTARRA